MTAFDTVAVFTKQEEGGYTDDSRDSGNWSSGVIGRGRLIGSNMGVGAPAALSWMHPNEGKVTAAWMRSSVGAIWQPLATVRYWRPLCCDKVPAPLTAMLFDYGWNRGIANSARQLQEALGFSRSEQDGDVGAQTLAAVAAMPIADLLTRFADAQEQAYRALFNFAIYGQGWLSRTDRRLRLARSMAGVSPPVAVSRTASAAQPLPAVSTLDPADALDNQFNPGL